MLRDQNSLLYIMIQATNKSFTIQSLQTIVKIVKFSHFKHRNLVKLLLLSVHYSYRARWQSLKVILTQKVLGLEAAAIQIIITTLIKIENQVLDLIITSKDPV